MRCANCRRLNRSALTGEDDPRNVRGSATRLLSCAHIRPIRPIRSFGMALLNQIGRLEYAVHSARCVSSRKHVRARLGISAVDNLLSSDYAIAEKLRSGNPIDQPSHSSNRTCDAVPQEVRNTKSGTNMYKACGDQDLLVAARCRRPEPCPRRDRRPCSVPGPASVAFSSLFIARSCHVGGGRAVASGATVYHGSDHGKT